MRDYSKVGPKFWIGSTGKRLRSAGMEAQIVGMYLLTSPHANMLGLFYCPLAFIAHETGLGIEGASKGLYSAIEAGFCEYDEASEVVWVIEMASYQVGEALQPKDLRAKGVQNEYNSLPENPYLTRFFEKYGTSFCMASSRGTASPLEAPSMPLGSQEQEQEHEQEQKQEQKRSPDKSASLRVSDLVALEIPEQLAKDFLSNRKAKKSPLTQTALDGIAREAAQAGITLAVAIRTCTERGWAGFKAEWLANQRGGKPDIEAQNQAELQAFLGGSRIIDGECSHA